MTPTIPEPAVFPHRWIVSLVVIAILAALLVAGVSCADSPRDATSGDAGAAVENLLMAGDSPSVFTRL